MKKYFGFLILFTLVICLSSLSAADVSSNNTISDTAVTSSDDTTTSADVISEDDIDKSINKLESKEQKQTSQTIEVTNKNYKKYFLTDEDATSTSVNSGDVINLQGKFNNIDFAIDKKNITITSIGKNATLYNCSILISGVRSSYSKISNLTIINTKDNCEAIIVENATNVNITDNHIFANGSNDFIVTTYIMKKSYIANNYFESNHTQTNMRLYASDNNYILNNTIIGTANGIYLCAYGQDNETNETLKSNNNIIAGNNLTGKSIFSTCYPIQIMGKNNRAENNTVDGGNRGISSEGANIIRYNTIKNVVNGIYTGGNSSIENNKINCLYMNSTGIIVNGNNSIVKNNTIDSDKNGITIMEDNITVVGNTINTINYSIFSKKVRKGYNNTQIINNTLVGEVYNTGEMTLTGNNITSSSAKEGGAVYNTGTMTLNNNIISSNNATAKGGAIYNSGTLKLTSNQFIQNAADTAGAIYTKTSSVTSSDNIFKYNSPSSFKIENNTIILQDEGNFIPTSANVKIYENGKLIKSTTMKNSKVDYTVPSSSHSYELVLTTTNFSNNRFTVTNNNVANLKLVAPTSIDTGKTATFKIIVTDADTNKKLNGTAIIKVNGLTLKDDNNQNIQLKVVNGEAALNYSLKGYSARSHVITAVFAKTGYERAEINTTMHVNKVAYAPFSFVINGCSEKVITINKTLKDVNGNILGGNNKIAIKVGDRTVLTTTTTDGKLNAKFTLPYLPEGKINVIVTLGENYRYNMIKFNTTANIHKQNVTVTINNITAKVGSKITIKAKLINSETKTNVLSGKYIFKVNGKTVPLITNGQEVSTTKIVSNGTAQWEYTLPTSLTKGQYEILLAYNGNTQSNSIRYSSKALTITG